MKTSEITNNEELFKKIDDYLIKDILRMLEVEPSSTGGLGYPCLQSIIAGMELLGKLISDKKSRNAFRTFWPYLKPCDNRYNEELEAVFSRVIRNSIAHYFLSKSNIYVSLHQPEDHLIVVENGYIHISCEKLFDHFCKGYDEIRKKAKEDPTIIHLESFMRELTKDSRYIGQYLETQGVTEEVLDNLKNKEHSKISTAVISKIALVTDNQFANASGTGYTSVYTDQEGKRHLISPSA